MRTGERLLLPLLLALASPRFVSAATVYYDPAWDVQTQWTPSAAGTHYTLVDDAVRAPSVPTTTDYITTATNTYADEFRFPSVTQSSISRIVAYAYVSTGNKAEIVLSLKQGATTWAATTVPISTGNSWTSFTWSAPSGDLSSLTVSAKFSQTGTNPAAAYVYAAYLLVDYTPPTPTPSPTPTALSTPTPTPVGFETPPSTPTPFETPTPAPSPTVAVFTAFFDPNSDVQTNWNPAGSIYHWECVSDGVRYSSVPDINDYLSRSSDATDEWGFASLNSLGTVNSIAGHVYLQAGSTMPVYLYLQQGGTTRASATYTSTSAGWTTFTWSTPSGDLSNLTIEAFGDRSGAQSYAYIYAAYISALYNPPPPSPTVTPTPAGYRTPSPSPTDTPPPTATPTATVTPTGTPTPLGYKTPLPTPSAPPSPSPMPPTLDGIIDDIYYEWGKHQDFEGFYEDAKAVLHLVDLPEVDPYYIWIAWEIDRDFNDNSYGTNIHFTWDGGHIWDDLLESDLQRLAISNMCGEVVVDATMDYVDGPPYHAAYPTASGYDVNMDSTESVKNYINGNNWSTATFAYKTSIVYNQNHVVSNQTTSPAWADETNYVAAAPYQDWEYSLVWEMRIRRDLFVTSSCPDGGVWPDVTAPLELHASPSKAGVSPVVNFRWTGVIGDYVWLDADRDGIQDLGERGIPNVTLALYNDPDADGDPDGGVIGTAVTNIYGKYLFDKLGHGYYVVVVTDTNHILDGYTATVGTTNPHGPIDLERRERYLDADFGYCPPPSAIGDYVWADTDADGRQDKGEMGIGGVTLDLFQDTDGDGNFTDWVMTTSTSYAGYYMFMGLDPGDYVVDVTDTGGVISGWNHVTGPQSMDDPTQPIYVGPGQIFLNADFGYHTTALGTIGTTVWYDENMDGTWQKQTEEGILYVTTELIRDADGDGTWDSGERIVSTAETTDYGTYYFRGVPLDHGTGTAKYLVYVSDIKSNVDRFRLSTGPGTRSDNVSKPSPYGVTLSAQTTADYTADFGYYFDSENGIVGDQVWYDVNRDGIKQDPEQGVEEARVRCWKYQGSTYSVLIGTTETDHSGLYFFPLLDLGRDYRTEVMSDNFSAGEVLYGYTGTNQPDNMDESHTLTSGDKSDLTLDYGYYRDVPTWHLGDYVWEDTDADGVQDGGESGIEGVTLEVYEDKDGDGIIEEGDTLLSNAYTNASGWYSMTGLPSGDYVVRVTDEDKILNGYYQTGDPDEAGVCSVCDAEGTGEIASAPNLTFDFGFVREGQEVSGKLGDRVWIDENKNGRQDAGEAGLPGVKVNLYKSDHTLLRDTVSTATGFYEFSDLPVGSYYVEFTDVPQGYYFAPQDRGDDDAVDSDPDIFTRKTVLTTLTSAEVDMTWDAGLYTVGSLCFDVQALSLLSAQTGSVAPVPAGLEATTNVPKTSAIAAFCTFNGEPLGGSATGRWDLRMDGAWNSQTVRWTSSSGVLGMGGIVHLFENAPSGLHTVELRHSTSDGAVPVRTDNARLVVLPLTSGSGQVALNYGFDTLAAPGDTTASAALEAVDGLSTSVTLDFRGRIFIAASLESESAAGGTKTGSWDLTANGIPAGQAVRRRLSGTNDLGPVLIFGLSGVLNAGTYPVVVRHATDAGTLRTAGGSLLAFALSNDNEEEDTAIGSSLRSFSAPTGTFSTYLADIAWSENTMYVGMDDQILVAASFTAEHGSGAGARTARYDITVASDPETVTAEGTVDLSGSDDLSAGGLVGLSDPLAAEVHTGYLRSATSGGSAEVLTGDLTFITLGICCEATPTGVRLKDLDAAGYDGLAAVEWETAAETGALGFYVLRTDRADGSFRRLNGQIILARGGVSGGRYLFLDYDVENGNTYSYRLEVVALTGESSFFGPVLATPLASAGFPSKPPESYLVVETNVPLSPTPEPTPISRPTPPPLPTPYSLLPILASGDYDGDGLSDIAVFRPSTATWFIRGVTREAFGLPGDIPASGDYDGDGVSEIAVFRPANGFWSVKGVTRAHFGGEGDVPVPSDYDGDGTTGIAIFRPLGGLWAVREFSRSFFGTSGDSPAPSDYDGDGTADAAVFRSGSALWAVKGVTRALWGEAGDLPVPGDYDGDGTTGIAVFRPHCGGWLIRNITRLCFGAAGDCPAVGDYDGDGADEIAVFRPALGGWMIRELTRAALGTAGDVPVAR